MNKKSIIVLVILLVCFLGCTEQADNNGRQKEGSEKILIELLGDSISVKREGLVSTIEYCPDNTCESFSTSTQNPSQKLTDFVYIYLFFVSDYNALADFKNKTGNKYISEIIKRNSEGCVGKSDREMAKCILKLLANRYSIKIKFVRYDENRRNEVGIDLKAQLNQLK